MNAKEFSNLLRKLAACSEARQWAKGKSLAEVWAECERGDWLLWLCAKMIGEPGWPTHKEIVLAACACAEPALKYVKKGEDRPRIAIETARRWASGNTTDQEVQKAAATGAYAYAYAAAGAYAYAYAAYAAAAGAYAADAAYAAAAAAYAADARSKSLRESADLVRANLKLPVMPDLEKNNPAPVAET